MKASLLLADYAQVADGKLNVIGGGWTVTGPEPVPFAIAALIEVPWDRSNEQHRLRLELVDADGASVFVPIGDGDPQPLVVDAGFEVGRPAGLKPGTSLNVPVAINLGPQALPPGARYEWRLSINGESDEDWRLPFSVRPEV